MNWIDIAAIVFAAVTVNHLGLIRAIELVTGRILPVLNCGKCLTFWSVLIFMVLSSENVIRSVAISLLASYTALWLELFEGFIDVLYNKVYEKIYSTSINDKDPTQPDNGNSAGSMSEL